MPTLTPTLALKNYRSCRGMEGDAFSCTLYLNGKRAALVEYRGDGGAYWYDWSPSSKTNMHGGPMHDLFKAYVDALPEVPPSDAYPYPLKRTMDCMIEAAVETMLANKQLRKWCKSNKALVYRTPGMSGTDWFITRVSNTVRHRAVVLKKHPDAEFGNDRFWAPPKAA